MKEKEILERLAELKEEEASLQEDLKYFEEKRKEPWPREFESFVFSMDDISDSAIEEFALMAGWEEDSIQIETLKESISEFILTFSVDKAGNARPVLLNGREIGDEAESVSEPEIEVFGEEKI